MKHETDFRESGRNTKSDDAFVLITSRHKTTQKPRDGSLFIFSTRDSTRGWDNNTRSLDGKHHGVQEQGQRRVPMGFLQRVSRAYRHTPGSHLRSLFVFCMVGWRHGMGRMPEIKECINFSVATYRVILK